MKFLSALAAAALTFAPVSAFAKPGVCMIKTESSSIQRFSCDIDVQVQQSDKHVVVITSEHDNRMKLTFTPDGNVFVSGGDQLEGSYPFALTKDGHPVIKFENVFFHFRISANPTTTGVSA